MKSELKENIFHFYKKYLSPKLWVIIFIVFLIILTELLSNATPYFYKLIIDSLGQFSAGNITKTILIKALSSLIIFLFLFNLFRILFQALRLYLINKIEAEAIKQVASDFVRQILNLSFHFHAHKKTGEISKRFSRGVRAVEEFIDSFIFNFFPNIFELTIITIIYFIFDWQSGLILFLMIVLFIFSTAILNNWQQRYRKIANDFEDQTNRKAIDSFINAEAVKYFSQENYELNAFNKLNSRWQKAQLIFWNRYITVELVQGLIITGGSILILIFSINRVINNTFSIGSLVMMLTYLARVYFPLFSFQYIYRRFRTSLTDLESIMGYFKLGNEIKDIPAAKNLIINRNKMTLEFKDVSFKYEDGKEILKKVSFFVPAGKSLAIVGPSGVGKSTLIKLLYRFYNVTSGQILIAGQDINQVKQDSLRKQLVIVPQETALFNETIEYNIRYGKVNASTREIGRAANFARIADFIKSLKDGYQTLVGERGIRLSGGEKQRVSIARAVLRNAPILILDEATSSLDSAIEREIQTSLEKLIKNKTTIIIAHRLSTVMKADFILVLEKGSVVQMGRHEQLLKKGGLYQKLWQLQAGGYIK